MLGQNTSKTKVMHSRYIFGEKKNVWKLGGSKPGLLSRGIGTVMGSFVQKTQLQAELVSSGGSKKGLSGTTGESGDPRIQDYRERIGGIPFNLLLIHISLLLACVQLCII